MSATLAAVLSAADWRSRRGASLPCRRRAPRSRALPGVPAARRARARARRARLAHRRPRRLRRRRRLLDRDPAARRCARSAPTRCWELPSRFGDGYGLSHAAVERLAARAASDLLITVDCGVTAVAEVAAARAAGMDVLVVDHHHAGRGRCPTARSCIRRWATTRGPSCAPPGSRSSSPSCCASRPGSRAGADVRRHDRAGPARGAPRAGRARHRLRPRAAARREPPHRARGRRARWRARASPACAR